MTTPTSARDMRLLLRAAANYGNVLATPGTQHAGAECANSQPREPNAVNCVIAKSHESGPSFKTSLCEFW